jgi:protocatechuate 3,4-dioxygenase beta subunit
VDGYRLRGHQHTDRDGHYHLETVIPADYEDTFTVAGQELYIHRTPHIHVKIKARRRQTLTTQLYLPDHPMNKGDLIYKAGCNLTFNAQSPCRATFDFVLI